MSKPFILFIVFLTLVGECDPQRKIPPRFKPPKRPPGHLQNDIDYEWDFFVLSQRWPAAFCHLNPGVCNEVPTTFTIYGFWPYNISTGILTDCIGSHFELDPVSDFREDLDIAWPALDGSGANEALWELEWDKYGRCSESLLDQATYFHTALILKNQFDILGTLADAGIIPDGGFYGVLQIIQVITESLHVHPLLKCGIDEGQESLASYVLTDIYLCVDKLGQTFVDCPPPPDDLCGGRDVVKVIFAEPFPPPAVDYEWDLFILSQQWPAAFCHLNPGVCNEGSHEFPSTFTIHGFLPYNISTGILTDCIGSHFELDSVSDFREDLDIAWPALDGSGNNEALWEHEWDKYGRCSESLLDQTTYFTTALILKNQFDILGILADSGIIPDGGFYGVLQILRVITESLHVHPLLKCEIDEGQESLASYLLTDIYLCVDKLGQTFVDCPPPPDNLCGGKDVVKVIFAEPFPPPAIDYEWDLFILSQQWPAAFCHLNPGVCNEGFHEFPSTFTVHGFLPYNISTGILTDCIGSHFELDSVMDFREDLDLAWPALDGNITNEALWEHEWDKFGRCSETLLDQTTYFHTALLLKNQFGVLGTLADSGIIPDGGYYGVLQIIQVITESLHVHPLLKCEIDKGEELIPSYVLTDIYLCVDKFGQSFVDCPPLRVQLCGGRHVIKVRFVKPPQPPSPPPPPTPSPPPAPSPGPPPPPSPPPTPPPPAPPPSQPPAPPPSTPRPPPPSPPRPPPPPPPRPPPPPSSCPPPPSCPPPSPPQCLCPPPPPCSSPPTPGRPPPPSLSPPPPSPLSPPFRPPPPSHPTPPPPSRPPPPSHPPPPPTSRPPPPPTSRPPPPPPCESPPPPPPDINYKWDLFILSQRWPAAFCHVFGPGACDVVPSIFTIFGFWPYEIDQEFFFPCNGSTFEPESVSDFRDELDLAWPALSSWSNEQNWEWQWEFFGRCSESLLDQTSYFHTALVLKNQFDLLDILAESGIIPDGGSYGVLEIIEVITESVHVRPLIYCERDSGEADWSSQYVLTDIYLCVDKFGQSFVDCPPIRVELCGGADVVKVGFLEPPPPPSPPPPPLPDIDYNWDLFILSQRWPAAFCHAFGPGICEVVPSTFTIFGFWPYEISQEILFPCNGSTFEPESVSDFRDDLNLAWPALSSWSNEQNWEWQWEFFGRCSESLLDQTSYFHTALVLKNQYDLLDILAESGIIPDGGSYGVLEIIEVITESIHVRPLIYCERDSGEADWSSQYVLTDIYLCVDKFGRSFVDCPPIRVELCGGADVVKVGFLEPPPPSSPPPPPLPLPLSLPDIDYKWDFFIFSQRWPAAFCQSYGPGSCSEVPSTFTIHGLWPFKIKEGTPSFCTGSPFKPESVLDYREDLDRAWRASTADWNNEILWKSEWETIGRCSESLFDQTNYFQKALDLKNQFHLLDILAQSDIIPDGRSYEVRQIIQVLRESLHVRPLLSCKIHYHSGLNFRYVLTDIYLCLDKVGQSLVDCPPLRVQLCGGRDIEKVVFIGNVLRSNTSIIIPTTVAL